MAGHSQFKNIMHRKGAQDAKRGKIFAKMTREIIVSVKSGGADPHTNPRLRSALSSARGANMPRENIDRAIKKALGDEDTTNFEHVRYEGYGPEGTAFIVEALTDNRNRTASEIRAAFTKFGGNLGETGSVSFLFIHKGVVYLPKSSGSFEEIFEKSLDLNADDVEELEDSFQISTSIDNFSLLRDALMDEYQDQIEAMLVWHPLNLIDCREEINQKLFKLWELLEDNDDVQNVYGNFTLIQTTG